MSPWLAGALGALVVLLAAPPAVPHLPGWPSFSWRGRTPTRRAELAWVDAVVEEVRAGRDPASALEVAAADWPVCPGALVAARSGDDVAAALAAEARSDLMRGVAACWSVAQGTGAGLAAALGALSDSAREAEAIRAELRVGVAEPRATAVVLALLPLAGLALGWLLGADPLAWLLGSTPGRLVLLAGVALDVAGAAWAWRIVHGLEDEL